MRLSSFLFVFALLVSASLFAQPKSLEEQSDAALKPFGLSRESFVSERAWAEDDSFLLPKIHDALTSPFTALDIARNFSSSTPSGIHDLGKVNDMASFLEVACPPAVCADIDSQLAHSPSRDLDPFEPLTSAFTLAEGYRKQAFDSLSGDELQALLLGIPLWFEDEDNPDDDSLKGALFTSFGISVDTTQKVDADSVLTLLFAVNRNALAAGFYAFAKGLTLASSINVDPVAPKKPLEVPGATGQILAFKETPFGKFVYGGPEANSYSSDFALIIDSGGDDVYRGRCGAAVGGISRTLSAVVDLGGNDTYDSDQLCSAACGVLGYGAIIDLSGNDIYRSASFSQSAAFCGGAILADGGGDDTYRAGWFSQAAAVCGVAVLLDHDGRDIYDGEGNGQAFSSTYAAAALVDSFGNDVYRAGGFASHAPLRPEDYRSLSQGFSIGSRPRGGGGFAILHDCEGNDFYDAEIYAQGVGYWYSMGILIDDKGSDAYDATQYSQGSGIHLAAGILEDGAGDDRYGSRFGPGQGAAHDLAVGVLYEHGGDDQYTISGGQALSLTNSASLFYDASGNDLYSANEADGANGGVRAARGFGNIALFMDGEGRDVYGNRSGRDSVLWARSVYAIGMDVPFDSLKPREAPVEVTLAPEDTQRTIEEIFKDAALWEVTDNREKVRHAALALKTIGVPAVKWVGENKMTSNDALERRAILELFEAFPDSAEPYVKAALDSDHKEKRRNAIAAYGKIKTKNSSQHLIHKLQDSSFERMRPAILSTLGDIGDTTCTAVLQNYSKSKVERERIMAVAALGTLKFPPAVPAMVQALSDPALTVRTAAIYSIGMQTPASLPALQREIMTVRDVAPLEGFMLGIGMLGESWSGDDKNKANVKKLIPLARRYLEFPDGRVQGAALVAASKIMDKKTFEKATAKFNSSEDPVLRARWREATIKNWNY